jgi:hypothetical protein
VLVPVVFAFDNTETDHRFVYLAESLVVPLVLAAIGDGFVIDYLKRSVQNIQAGLVGEGGGGFLLAG